MANIDLRFSCGYCDIVFIITTAHDTKDNLRILLMKHCPLYLNTIAPRPGILIHYVQELSCQQFTKYLNITLFLMINYNYQTRVRSSPIDWMRYLAYSWHYVQWSRPWVSIVTTQSEIISVNHIERWRLEMSRAFNRIILLEKLQIDT